MFWHEKLKVYGKALDAAASLAELSASWEKKHSIVDHLSRASEGIVLNIAEGTRLQSAGARQHMLNYAVGSTLECAACLDIAAIKRLLPLELQRRQKEQLCEIVKMLVGLRKSWAAGELREESPEYGGGEGWAQSGPLFGHERLDVYQTALEFMRWFNTLPAGATLCSRLYRQVDKVATSLILNIAEGNGRYPEEDRRRFLDIAEASAVKAAAYLDLCQRKEGLDEAQRQGGIELLLGVSRMLRGLAVISQAPDDA